MQVDGGFEGHWEISMAQLLLVGCRLLLSERVFTDKGKLPETQLSRSAANEARKLFEFSRPSATVSAVIVVPAVWLLPVKCGWLA